MRHSWILIPLFPLALSCDHRGAAPAAAAGPAPATQAQVDELREQVKALQALVPDQAAVMNHLSQHFTNLWFALEAENWPLAAFYLSETRSNLRWAVRAKPLRKTSRGEDVDVKSIAEAVDQSQLQEIELAIGRKDRARAEELYRQTLVACHSCHQASEKPYLMTQVPAEPEVRSSASRRPRRERDPPPEAGPAAPRGAAHGPRPLTGPGDAGEIRTR